MPLKDPEARKAWMKEYRERKKAGIAPPPKKVLTAEERAEKAREYTRLYKERHREDVKARQREHYRKKHPLLTAEQRAEMYARIAEKTRARYAAQRAERQAERDAAKKAKEEQRKAREEKSRITEQWREEKKRRAELEAKAARRKALGLDKPCEMQPKEQKTPKPNAEALAILRARESMKKLPGRLWMRGNVWR